MAKGRSRKKALKGGPQRPTGQQHGAAARQAQPPPTSLPQPSVAPEPAFEATAAAEMAGTDAAGAVVNEAPPGSPPTAPDDTMPLPALAAEPPSVAAAPPESTAPLPTIERPANLAAAVIGQVAAGDQAAYSTLYDHYVDHLYRFCYFWTGQRSSAERLTTLTFQRAWAARAQWPAEPDHLLAWLLTTCQHLFRQIDAAVTPTTTPLSLALRQLPDDERTVLLLRTIGGCRLDEVATTLGWVTSRVAEIEQDALGLLDHQLSQATPPTSSSLVSSVGRSLKTRLTRLIRRDASDTPHASDDQPAP